MNARQAEAEALQWLSRRVDPGWSDVDQAELDAWLQQGFAHRAAYWRLEEAWERAGRMAALGRLSSEKPVGRRSSGWSLAAAAALTLAVTGTAYQLLHQPPATEQRGRLIATRVGGHTVVPLADGSTIELNTATLVRATVSAERREIWLERGEAYFNVLHSATVPFIVHAGPKTIAVLGTKFSVRREGDLVTVAVQSGRVRVTDAQPTPNALATATETYVGAGSVAVSRPDETLVTESSPENVEMDLAWRHGQLIFRNATLAAAAEEFNRYNDRKIVVSGKAAELTISGSFKSSNEEGFGRLLRNAYGVTVTIGADKIRVTG
jgi:transmembrane sensor